jgi:hypothetical protein
MFPGNCHKKFGCDGQTLLVEKGEEGAFGGKERWSRRRKTKKKIISERDRRWEVGEFVGAYLAR